MNTQQIDAFYSLALAVRRLFHKLGHGVGALHQGSDVSAGMRAVLETLTMLGPKTVPEMARMRPVTRQHIQGLVNPLLENGYVEYVDNPAHKRSNLVRVTPKGSKTFQAMRALENESFEQITRDVSAEDFEAAHKVLSALIEVLDGPQWRAIVNRHVSQPDE